MKFLNRQNIIIFLAIIVIAMFTYEIYRLETMIDNVYKKELRLIDSKIKQKDSVLFAIKKKVAEIQKKDSLQQKKINYLKWKLKKYEKKTDINHINSLARDSVRAILTH